MIDLKNVLQQLNQGEEENKKLHITKTRAETLKAHHGYVYALTLVGHKLISSSGDGTIIVFALSYFFNILWNLLCFRFGI